MGPRSPRLAGTGRGLAVRMLTSPLVPSRAHRVPDAREEVKGVYLLVSVGIERGSCYDDTMDETMTVERLDRSRPPPGYHHSCPIGVAALGQGPVDRALAAAWDHYEKRNDPPGLRSHNAPHGRARWSLVGPPMVTFVIADHATLDAARAAAWSRYWRRVALSISVNTDTLDRIQSQSIRDPWPRCLAWSDEEVADVKRWLADGGEVPEVLR
jgi:hypothetical protein